jgi:hypothetical protein
METVKVRVFGSPRGGTYPVIKEFKSTHVPRAGEYWCIEYWSAEVYRVEWTLLSGGMCADVYCDTSKIDKKMKDSASD